MEMSWCYIAGFFDGEGSLSLIRRKTGKGVGTMGFVASIGQSSLVDGPTPVLVEIAAFLEEAGIRCGVYKGRPYTGKFVDGREARGRLTPYCLQIFNRAGVQRFVEGALPYLRVKKVLAEDVLRALKLFPDTRGYFSEKRQQGLTTAMVEADRASGMTYEQIATKYTCSLATVFRRLHVERSRQYLRDHRARKRALAL